MGEEILSRSRNLDLGIAIPNFKRIGKNFVDVRTHVRMDRHRVLLNRVDLLTMKASEIQLNNNQAI